MSASRKVTPWLGLCALGFALVLGGCSKKTVADPSDGLGTQTTTTDNTGSDQQETPKIQPPDEIDRPATLSDVFFDFDAHNLRADARRTLETNADAVNANPEWRILTLEGHCDERGTVEYNLALGQKRANAVKNYLMQLGVSGERLQTISYGEERPFDPGHTEAAWAQNRRVHFAR